MTTEQKILMEEEINIEESNKLIAEFMGKTVMNYKVLIRREWGFPKYHQSWDWLMPVVEKIETLFDNRVTVLIQSGEYAIWLHNKEEYEKSNYNTYDYYSSDWKENKIEAVYEQVVKFIKWYNQQEK